MTFKGLSGIVVKLKTLLKVLPLASYMASCKMLWEKAPVETDLAWISCFDAVINYPKSYDSYSVLIELVDACAPVDDLDRGIADYHAG